MHYQVVARSCLPSAGDWDYYPYPYLAPGRDEATAERLARYAAQSGHEAAILQSVTAEMLVHIARAVVEQQDEHMVPTLRYMPGARAGRADTWQRHEVEVGLRTPVMLDPYSDGPDKAELDARRSLIEMGSGGDVVAKGVGRNQPISLPLRMDILGAWLRLRERVVQSELGGADDGADVKGAR